MEGIRQGEKGGGLFVIRTGRSDGWRLRFEVSCGGVVGVVMVLLFDFINKGVSLVSLNTN